LFFILIKRRRKKILIIKLNKMELYNTKTRKLEKFKPLADRELKIYYCGPTVYNYAHI
jgi:cysteinyl-tRNA synthetase